MEGDMEGNGSNEQWRKETTFSPTHVSCTKGRLWNPGWEQMLSFSLPLHSYCWVRVSLFYVHKLKLIAASEFEVGPTNSEQEAKWPEEISSEAFEQEGGRKEKSCHKSALPQDDVQLLYRCKLDERPQFRKHTSECDYKPSGLWWN